MPFVKIELKVRPNALEGMRFLADMNQMTPEEIGKIAIDVGLEHIFSGARADIMY